VKKVFIMLAMCFVSNIVLAAESPGAFKIKEIFISQAENFHFRVVANYTNPEAWHCHNGPKNPAWSYINEGDSGAKGMMSTLLMAYAAKKTVTLTTLGVDTPAGHMCKIIEFSIKD